MATAVKTMTCIYAYLISLGCQFRRRERISGNVAFGRNIALKLSMLHALLTPTHYEGTCGVGINTVYRIGQLYCFNGQLSLCLMDLSVFSFTVLCF